MLSSGEAARRFKYTLKRLNKKYLAGHKIRVGFSLIFDSVFPMRRVFELMRNDNFFDPFLVVMPDTARGHKNMLECYIKTLLTLKKTYQDATILQPLDYKNNEIEDIISSFDLYCPANPYDTMNADLYKNERFFKKSIPIFYTSYGPIISKWYQKTMEKDNFYSKIWRFYANNKNEVENIKEKSIVRLSGNIKMDTLADIKESWRSRKRIIIAPHHTIFYHPDSVSFGNFLQYADFFLKLPGLYPDIDFIFRPHPLLINKLTSKHVWGSEKTEQWLKNMAANTNVEMQSGGDYMATFANSDGLIHDCGSFLQEYMFTGKPCCYILNHDYDVKEQMNDISIQCLDAHYHAYSKTDIAGFIEKTIIGKRDPLFKAREKMLNELNINHPNCSQFVIDDIKTAIINAEQA